MTKFDYNGLPFKAIAAEYRRGVSWRELARRHGAPDHKTLARHVLARCPELEPRNHAEAQRARRDREGTSRRVGRKRIQRPRY